ncbi:hypothetical protein ACROYT_G009166, partial [Oculina patagonica]
ANVLKCSEVRMKVICAGLMKTGTSTLTKALQVLGYNVYGAPDGIKFHQQEWLDSFGTDHLPNFEEIFKGVDAVTDHPAAFWFEEISNAFPEAKIILTVRDSEEVWLKSWQEHLRIPDKLLPFYMKIILEIAPSRRKTRHYFNTMHRAVIGGTDPEAGALYRGKYRQHNARVPAVIPAEKLLVYNVKQGWKPLCEFLGCDVPCGQFPRANAGHSSTEIQMSQEIEQAINEATTAFIFAFVILCLLTAIFYLF